MTVYSPMKTRASTNQGYKICREQDVHTTLLQLDNVANGIKNHEGEEDVKAWMDWRKKGLLAEEVGNNLVKMCEIIGISTKTRHIDEVFQAIVDANPAIRRRLQFRRSAFGNRSGMRYKINYQFNKKVKAKAKATKTVSEVKDNVWKTDKRNDEDKTTTKKVEVVHDYDKMDSDIEDDRNTTPEVVELDQDSETEVHGINDGVKATRDKAKADVRNFFQQKLKQVPEANTTVGKDAQNRTPPDVNQGTTESNIDDKSKVRMTILENDLTEKFERDIKNKMEDKL